jgi:hypothetical protein
MLSGYMRRLETAQSFVFFEQVARAGHVVQEYGQFYKKVRTREQYEALFDSAKLRTRRFEILNEKGYGPLYSLVYLTSVYRYWPRWLNLNRLLFAADRRLVERSIADRFTDAVFVCSRKPA